MSLLPNINTYQFRNEESLRVTIAYEMSKSSHYLQPYLLGEPYYNKPPFFNWLIALYSNFIPWSELTARAVSLTFLMLSLLTIFIFSYHLFKNLSLSLLSALSFLTFGNVLFFYGYLAEIDMTFTFFTFCTMLSLHMWLRQDKLLWGVCASFLAGIGALLKGFPAYAFYALTFLSLVIYQRRWNILTSRKVLLVHSISLILPALWLVNTYDPLLYLKTLFYESFSRVGSGSFSRTRHMLTFPFINLKDMLPNSLLFFIALYTLLKQRKLEFPQDIRLLSLVFFVNYLPYLFSNSAGRYVMPLYPLLAVIFSFYMHKSMENAGFRKLLYTTLLFTVILRFAYGFIYFEYYNHRESSRKLIAEKIIKSIDLSSTIECQCRQELSVCLYVSLAKGEPLKQKLPNALYSISCENGKNGEVLMRFDVDRSYQIKLLRLRPNG